MGPGDLDDLRADGALALGDDARRAGLVIMQRDRKLAFGIDAHSARSRKWPARAAGAACGGAPSRITISPGCSSARLSAWLSSDAPARSCCRGRRPLRPHPHRGLVADQRDQRMNRPGRLDIERESRPPHPLGGLDVLARRHRGKSRTAPSPCPAASQTEFRNSSAAQSCRPSAPKCRCGPAARPPAAGFAARSRHRCRRADDARSSRAAHPARSWAMRRLRGRQRAAERRRRRVGVNGHVARHERLSMRGGCAHRVAELLQRFLQQVQGRTGRRSGVERRRKRIAARPGRPARDLRRPAAVPAAAGFPATSRLGDEDGARLAAVACGGAACVRCRRAGVATVALTAKRRLQRLAQHDQRGLEVGNAAGGD